MMGGLITARFSCTCMAVVGMGIGYFCVWLITCYNSIIFLLVPVDHEFVNSRLQIHVHILTF